MHYLAELIKPTSRLDCLKDPGVLEIESLVYSPFHLVALLIFLGSIFHTLTVHKLHNWARSLELKQAPKRLSKGTGRERSPLVQILYFLSEVEIVFAFWVIPLFFAIAFFYNSTTALEYINTRDYTEALFVVVILAIALTRPIVHAAELLISSIAKQFGNSLSAWWFTLLTIGPLLGSFITEVGAMALSALLLSTEFYSYRPSRSLSYATLALLFVNVSVGGILTNFASPAVLILSHAWDWSNWYVFSSFGWKAALGIVLSNLTYWVYFREEFQKLDRRKKEMPPHLKPPEPPPPAWVTIIHVLLMMWIVAVSYYPAIFIASFLFFIGFHHATRLHQSSIKISHPLLVGLFLAGLVIHGGLQGWWVVDLLDDLKPLAVMGLSIFLTAFNDNTAISYLTTLIPNWGPAFKYAVFTGVIAGGGLTVIGNAPNPAGYSLLKKHFEHGIEPIALFRAALFPTFLLYAIFYLFSPFSF